MIRAIQIQEMIQPLYEMVTPIRVQYKQHRDGEKTIFTYEEEYKGHVWQYDIRLFQPSGLLLVNFSKDGLYDHNRPR